MLGSATGARIVADLADCPLVQPSDLYMSLSLKDSLGRTRCGISSTMAMVFSSIISSILNGLGHASDHFSSIQCSVGLLSCLHRIVSVLWVGLSFG